MELCATLRAAHTLLLPSTTSNIMSAFSITCRAPVAARVTAKVARKSARKAVVVRAETPETPPTPETPAAPAPPPAPKKITSFTVDQAGLPQPPSPFPAPSPAPALFPFPLSSPTASRGAELRFCPPFRVFLPGTRSAKMRRLS